MADKSPHFQYWEIFYIISRFILFGFSSEQFLRIEILMYELVIEKLKVWTKFHKLNWQPNRYNKAPLVRLDRFLSKYIKSCTFEVRLQKVDLSIRSM